VYLLVYIPYYANMQPEDLNRYRS